MFICFLLLKITLKQEFKELLKFNHCRVVSIHVIRYGFQDAFYNFYT